MKRITPHGRKGRFGVFVAGALATALALAGCSAGGTSTAKIDPNAIIQAGISYTLSGSFDPILASGAVTQAADWHIFEGLTELDPVTRKPYAALAPKLPTKVNDTTYEVDIRDGAKFSNGTPVTVDDVLFSFERTLDSKQAGFFATFIEFIDKVTAVDSNTVRITTKYPFSLINERLAVVKIVPKGLVTANATEFGAKPVGTGPYKLISAVPNKAVVFEKNTNYNGTRPALAAGMNWTLLNDSAARVTAMTAGTIQGMEDVPYIDAGSLASKSKVSMEQSFGLLFMMFNTKVAPFDNPKVRQAFFYALDMDKIIKTAMLGNATAATSFLPKTHPNYHEASTVYTYNPTKAKELLASAGVNGMDLTLLTTDTGWVKDVAPLIKESLDAIGVKTTLDIAASGAQYKKVDAGEYKVMVAPGDPSVFGNDPDVLMRWWYGDNVWPTKRMNWSNTPQYKELTALLDLAVRETGDSQQQTWNKAFNVMADNVPLYPLFHRKVGTAWNPNALVGFKPINTTGLSFLDVGVAETTKK